MATFEELADLIRYEIVQAFLIADTRCHAAVSAACFNRCVIFCW